MKKLLLSLVASSLLMSTAVQAGATASNPPTFAPAYQIKVLFMADETVNRIYPFGDGISFKEARTKHLNAHISDINSIFKDSRINLKAVNVGFLHISGSASNFTNFLGFTGNSEINEYKKQYGADMIYLFSTKTLGDGCGRASIGHGYAIGRPDSGTCVSTHTFNHQMGHVLGVYDYGDKNANPRYAQGYKTDVWDDIMATEKVTGARIIKRNFSNPNIRCDAMYNCGDSAHNAVKAINESVPKRFSKIQ